MFKKGETICLKNGKQFKKKTFIIVSCGGFLLFPLCTISFLSSMWEPYGQLSDLPVAVVNNDKEASYLMDILWQ